MQTDGHRFVTAEQLASRWLISVRTVRRMIAAAQLPTVMLGPSGGAVRIPLDAVMTREATRTKAATELSNITDGAPPAVTDLADAITCDPSDPLTRGRLAFTRQNRTEPHTAAPTGDRVVAGDPGAGRLTARLGGPSVARRYRPGQSSSSPSDTEQVRRFSCLTIRRSRSPVPTLCGR